MILREHTITIDQCPVAQVRGLLSLLTAASKPTVESAAQTAFGALLCFFRRGKVLGEIRRKEGRRKEKEGEGRMAILAVLHFTLALHFNATLRAALHCLIYLFIAFFIAFCIASLSLLPRFLSSPLPGQDLGLDRGLPRRRSDH